MESQQRSIHIIDALGNLPVEHIKTLLQDIQMTQYCSFDPSAIDSQALRKSTLCIINSSEHDLLYNEELTACLRLILQFKIPLIFCLEKLNLCSVIKAFSYNAEAVFSHPVMVDEILIELQKYFDEPQNPSLKRRKNDSSELNESEFTILNLGIDLSLMNQQGTFGETSQDVLHDYLSKSAKRILRRANDVVIPMYPCRLVAIMPRCSGLEALQIAGNINELLYHFVGLPVSQVALPKNMLHAGIYTKVHAHNMDTDKVLKNVEESLSTAIDAKQFFYILAD